MLTPEVKEELADVVIALRGSLDQTTPDGVRIMRVGGFMANHVCYVDSNIGDPDQAVIREMSCSAYAAEFFKLCGGSLDAADFDQTMSEIAFVGDLLSNPILEGYSADRLKWLVSSSDPTPRGAIPASEIVAAANGRPHIWSEA